MPKKKRKSEAVSVNRRGQEKMRLACKSFSWAMGGYLIMVVLAVFIARSGQYDLSRFSLNGFAYGFLLPPAYLPLLLLNLIGVNIPYTGNEALLLGGCDIALAATVWGLVIWLGWRRQSIKLVRSIRIFVLIMFYWGVIQLLCTGAAYLWQRGSYGGLHQFNSEVDK